MRTRPLAHVSRSLGALLPVLALAACGSDAPAPAAPPPVTAPARAGIAFTEPRVAVTRDGLYRVSWAPIGGFVPVNEHFELEVSVTKNDAARTPVDSGAVVVDCQMPDHGHGMLREPRSEALGGGKHKVRGLLLHMGGHWTVALSVLVDGVASTADDSIDL